MAGVAGVYNRGFGDVWACSDCSRCICLEGGVVEGLIGVVVGKGGGGLPKLESAAGRLFRHPF